MFGKLTKTLSVTIILITVSFPQLRPDSFLKYDENENYIRDSVILKEKLHSVLDDPQKEFPLKSFIIGDSYIASGELAGYFEKEISSHFGKGGETLLAAHKKFPSLLKSEKFLVSSKTASITGFQLLTDARPDQIEITRVDGMVATVTIDSSISGGYLFSFREPLRSFYISTAKNVPEIRVSGIILLHSTRGVVSSYYGVESASLRTYNNQMSGVFDLLRLYQPDLLVINIGLNDCAGPNFTKNYADVELKYFLKKLKAVVPNTALLFTSPPGFYSGKKGSLSPSPNVNIFRERLDLLAAKEGFAWWDMRAVMGGDTSMDSWVKAGLAIGDHVHLTTHGMSLIAKLLSGAIVDLYKQEDEY